MTRLVKVVKRTYRYSFYYLEKGKDKPI